MSTPPGPGGYTTTDAVMYVLHQVFVHIMNSITVLRRINSVTFVGNVDITRDCRCANITSRKVIRIRKVNGQTETEATTYGEAVVVDVHYADNRPTDELLITIFPRLSVS